MYIQGVDNVFDLKFNDAGVTYGDVFLENEKQLSAYNFEVANTEALFDLFRKAAAEADTGLSDETRESVLAAHLAICKLKAGA